MRWPPRSPARLRLMASVPPQSVCCARQSSTTTRRMTVRTGKREGPTMKDDVESQQWAREVAEVVWATGFGEDFATAEKDEETWAADLLVALHHADPALLWIDDGETITLTNPARGL